MTRNSSYLLPVFLLLIACSLGLQTKNLFEVIVYLSDVLRPDNHFKAVTKTEQVPLTTKQWCYEIRACFYKLTYSCSSLSVCTITCHLSPDCNSFIVMPATVAGDTVGTCFLTELDGSQLILPIYLPGFPEEQVTMFTTKDPDGYKLCLEFTR